MDKITYITEKFTFPKQIKDCKISSILHKIVKGLRAPWFQPLRYISNAFFRQTLLQGCFIKCEI